MRSCRKEERNDRQGRKIGTDQNRERTCEARHSVDRVRANSSRKQTIQAAVTGTSLIGWIDW